MSDTVADNHTPRWRTYLQRAYGLALVMAAVGVLIVRRDQVGDLVAGARPGPLIGALLLGLVSLGQSAVFWSRALSALGSGRQVGEVLEATVAAIPARYVPGSVWYAAGRVGHLRQSGSSVLALSTVAGLETVLSFVIAVALGAGLVVASGGGDAGVGALGLGVVAIVLAVVASPSVVNPALRWVGARRTPSPPLTLRWAGYLELTGQLVVFWLTSALAFLSYLAAFPAIDAPGAVRTAGTFLLAWAAGFAAVFAPQGAGVFETTLSGLLTGAPVAALAVVIAGFRALTAVRDVIALLGLAIYRALASGSRISP